MRKSFFLLGSIVTVLLVVWLAGLGYFVSRMPMQPKEALTRADAIAIVTGGSLRVREGLDLLQSNVAKELFISGVGEGVNIEDIVQLHPYPESVMQYFGQINLGYHAQNTVGNAKEVADWAASMQVKTMYLVTAYYHMPRVLQEFQHAMGAVKLLPHPVFPETVPVEGWWMHPTSLSVILDEYHKFVVRWWALRLDMGA